MAAAVDARKYNALENVLNNINGEFISLSEADVRRNNNVLQQLLVKITSGMRQKDSLFKELYTRTFFGGSFYDGLRVTDPNEFDLDLLLSLPKLLGPKLSTSEVQGYVKLEVDVLALYRIPEMAIRYRGLDKLLSENYLDNQKVRQWMEGVVTTTLNDFKKADGSYELKVGAETFCVKIHKAGPAFTLKVNGNLSMDVDLVPCFEFTKDYWPKSPFKPNPTPLKSNFFIVPKPLKTNVGNSNNYWRLSFQEQERILMEGKQYLKPAIKLLKRMRDTLDHKAIASYYIKTTALLLIDKVPPEFWRRSLSNVFMTLLKEYYNYLNKGEIPYYWSRKNNLLKGISSSTKSNFANKIKAIINDVDKHLGDDPNVIVKYIMGPTTYLNFQKP